MEMTPEKWEKVKVLFEAALDKPTEQRIPYLADVCAEDDVREQVARLLANLEDAGNFLTKPALTGINLAAPSSKTENLFTAVRDTSIAGNENSKLIGQTLSHYRVADQIGAGGMGVVYRAYDEQLDRNVALKVLPSGLLADEDARKRFRKEALALAKLNHPNIETIFEFGSQAGVDFLAMELIPGEPLSEKLKSGPLSERDLMRFGVQLTEGLAAAHEQGIIHSDLKPANIFITPDNRLKILDFGLARLLKTGEDNDITKTVSSKTGAIAGTLPYMSPEQLRAGPIDARSDIYAAGTVLYEMATGKRPFPQQQPVQLITEILHTEPAPPSSINQHLQPGMESVILKALDKSPSERYQTAREFRIALETLTTSGFGISRVSTGYAPVAHPTQSQPRAAVSAAAPRWKTYAIGLIVLVAVGLAAAVWVFRERLFHYKTFRPTVAVIGFKNQSGTQESDWVSSSLSEWLSSDLAAGDYVVPIPGESVARMKIDLGLPEEGSYAPETIDHIKGRLHCDYVVYGAFFDPGKAAGGRVQLEVKLERASTHEVLATVNDSGTELAVPELASRVGASLRSKLGLPGISASDSSELQAATPSTSEAQRQYSKGLQQLRTFDLLGARNSLTSATKLDPNFPLAHAYLAEAWTGLGYDENAKKEAQSAFELSSHLGREDKTLVEARYREISWEWDKAIDLYRSLWILYPENAEYAFHTADMQIRGGKATDAEGTITELREQMGAAGNDPRLDLKEAEAADALSDYPKEKQAATTAANSARTSGYRLLEAEALWRACAAMDNLGETSGAQSACQRSIELAKPVNDLMLVARSYTILGLIASTQGDPKQALALHHQALEFARSIGSRRDVIGALTNIGNSLADQGDFTGAQKSYEDSLAVAQEIDDKGQAVTLLNNIATLAQAAGKFSSALKLFGQSLEQAREVKDKGSIARAQSNIGIVFLLQGNFPSALDNIRDAIQQARETGNKNDEALFLLALGSVYLDQGDLASAEQNYRSSLDLADQLNEKGAIARAQLAMASLKLQQGKSAEAQVLARQAADEFHAEAMNDTEADARNVLAAALLDLDRTDDAAKQVDMITHLSSQDAVEKLTTAITSARVEAHQRKAGNAQKALADIVLQAKAIGIPGLQFEAQLAEGETGLFGGDKLEALNVLSVLQKEAARKGYTQMAVRAKETAEKISRPKAS